MTHLATALFFFLALFSSAVAVHMTIRLYSAEILLALKGQWNGAFTAGARPKAAPAFAATTWRAAA